jgi:hypothetical protein
MMRSKTKVSERKIAGLFGAAVAAMVEEVTDNKELPTEERESAQIVHAPHLSPGAKLIKLADKISNLNSLTSYRPVDDRAPTGLRRMAPNGGGWGAQRHPEVGSAVRRGRGGRPRVPPARRVTNRGKYRSSGDGSAWGGSAGRWPHRLIPVAGTRSQNAVLMVRELSSNARCSALASPMRISLCVKGSHNIASGLLLNVLPDVVLYTRQPGPTGGLRDPAWLPVRTVSSHPGIPARTAAVVKASGRPAFEARQIKE